MINYKRYCLDNGLRILIHEDTSTPLVAMNVLYDVGSRDEDPDCTGMAHLLEHHMFGGSANIHDFDLPLMLAGGDNNGFTNTDITCYYLSLPSANIETGFWLESDRMAGLAFSEKNLAIQKNVVIEEYNQNYINQPYGDSMLIIRPMAYKVHPYRWATIGSDISHVRNASSDQVKSFFYSHYAPNNAILTLSGNIKYEQGLKLSEKWFGPIESRDIKNRNLPIEPLQKEGRTLAIEKDVPANALYKVWHSCPRVDKDFFSLDLITDLLAGGESGRLYTKLVRDLKLFSEINAYLSAEIDSGLIVFTGRLMKGTNIYDAEMAVNKVFAELKNKSTSNDELEKVKNKYESTCVFSNTNIMNKAINMAVYELMGIPEMINHEVEEFRRTDKTMVMETARKYFNDSNCCTLYYKSLKNE